MDKQVVITMRTIIYAFLIILGGFLIYAMRSIVATLFFSILIVIAMEHPIKMVSKIKFMNKPIGRSSSVIISYALAALVLISMIVVVLPPVVSQIQLLVLRAEELAESLGIDAPLRIESLLQNVTQLSGNFLNTTSQVFAFLGNILTLLFIAVFMSIDWPYLKKRIFSLFHGNVQEEVKTIFLDIEEGLGHWIKGQLYLMLVVGTLSVIGLFILQVEYALALGIIAGMLEIVPFFGPLIAAGIAALVVFPESLPKATLVIALFILIQQLENNLLVPKIMERVSGFRPLTILIALLIGSELFGILGAIAAVPVMMIIVILVNHLAIYNKNLKNGVASEPNSQDLK